MQEKIQVRENARIRVILDTDAACEADDQYAIVHALLTPKFQIRGIIAEQFFYCGGEASVEESFQEIRKLLELAGKTEVPVYRGLKKPLAVEEGVGCEAVDFLIEEALKEGEPPLYVLCQGAITNVAAALSARPEIADRFTCIWIGGGIYPKGGWEFNLTNDHRAANVVFESKLELWQVPMDGYGRMQVSYAELLRKVAPCGRIGEYLFRQLQELGRKVDWTPGESWALGDSPAVGLAMNPNCGRYEVRKAPLCDRDGNYVGETDREIRVYHEPDSRFILEDFFAKLWLSQQGGT